MTPTSFRLPEYLSTVSPRHALVWLLFFISGACGLIYEVLWCRQLGLIFGNTAHSLSAVLTAFMGGLALGSFVAGRLCHRLKRPLLVYGVLEFCIGVYCLLLPWLLSDHSPLVPLYRSLYGEAGTALLSPARFLLSFAVLLIPTALMGATLPVLSQFLVQSHKMLGRTVGALYAINSLGAVLGAAGAGFVLLPDLGKASTNTLAVCCNLALGVLAIAFGRRGSFGAAPDPLADARGSESVPPSPAAPAADARGSESAPTGGDARATSLSPQAVKAAILTFGVTGFAAMATQIGWTRAISLATGSSTYAFSLIVAVFILGLSLGGAWGARAAPRTRDPLALLARVLLLVGLLNLVVTVLLGYGPLLFFLLLAWFKDSSWSVLLAAQAFGVALLIIAPTMLMGATLPLTLQVAARSEKGAGRTVGTVYAVNTVGAILGSFLGGLVLLPALQTQSLLEVMALLYVLPALLLFWLSPSRADKRALLRFGLLLVPLVLVGAISRPWDGMLMSSGMYLLRDADGVRAARELRLRDALAGFSKEWQLVYCREGAECTVAVMQTPLELSLRIGGKPDASAYGDLSTQIFLTLLPEILHPQGATEVLVIGLGSGVSSGCALAPEGVQRVDIVEMSPQVVEASYLFREHNKLTYTDAEPCTLATPKVELILNDGRNHLLLTNRCYDVIASEPSNPWMAGVGNLFTKEAFELSASRLKPGGIMCQWLHSYQLEEAHFYSVIRTFGSVFTHIQLWQSKGSAGDYMLVGSKEEITIPVRRLQERLAQPEVKAWLKRIHYDTPAELLAAFLADNESLRGRTDGAALHTDDNMLLEFQAPRSLYRAQRNFQSSSFAPCADFVLDYTGLPAEERAEFVRALDLAVSAREHIRWQMPQVRDAHFDAAYKLAPYQFCAIEHKNAADQAEADGLLLGHSATATPNPTAAIKLLSEAEARSKYVRWSRAALNHALGEEAKALIKAGDAAGALAALDRIDAPEHSDQTALLRARALLLSKDYDKALAQVMEAGKSGRKPVECTVLAAEIMLKNGNLAGALATMDSNILCKAEARTDPRTAPLWQMRAEILLGRMALDDALHSIRIAERLAPDNPVHLRWEARILTRMGKLPEVTGVFRLRAALDPTSDLALVDLASALHAAAAKVSASDPRLAFKMLVQMRRASRELTVLRSETPSGWELLCRCFLSLEKQDTGSAAFYRREAERACHELLEKLNGDRSKLPPDLSAVFGQ